MNDLISVIVPVYNAEKYIKTCLMSIRMQSYKSFEVIIINDGSTDNSRSIIEEFINEDDRFKLINQENKGLGYSRNRGIKESRGKYLFFVDADDYIPKDSLKILYSAIQERNVDYAVGKVIRFNNTRRFLPVRHKEFRLYNKNIVSNLRDKPELLQDSIACNKLWKRQFIEKNNLFFAEGKLYEDLRMTLKAAVLAKNIAITKEIVYWWRVRQDSDLPSITQRNMELRNTLDRISALEDNMIWLESSKDATSKIIIMNKIKSLLDVLRMHVNQYAVVKESDKKIWEQKILKFVNDIQPFDIGLLPEKERIAYSLLLKKDFHRLYNLSKVILNMEKEPIVSQDENGFQLVSDKGGLDITPYIKPKAFLYNIEKKFNKVIFTGETIVPKCSKPIDCKVVFKSRNDHSVQYEDCVKLTRLNDNGIYTHENLKFEFILDKKSILNIKLESKGDIYLYFKNPLNTLVRIKTSDKNLFKKFNCRISLRKNIKVYETFYGNAILKLESFTMKRIISHLIKGNILKRKS